MLKRVGKFISVLFVILLLSFVVEIFVFQGSFVFGGHVKSKFTNVGDYHTGMVVDGDGCQFEFIIREDDAVICTILDGIHQLLDIFVHIGIDTHGRRIRVLAGHLIDFGYDLIDIGLIRYGDTVGGYRP